MQNIRSDGKSLFFEMVLNEILNPIYDGVFKSQVHSHHELKHFPIHEVAQIMYLLFVSEQIDLTIRVKIILKFLLSFAGDTRSHLLEKLLPSVKNIWTKLDNEQKNAKLKLKDVVPPVVVDDKNGSKVKSKDAVVDDKNESKLESKDTVVKDNNELKLEKKDDAVVKDKKSNKVDGMMKKQLTKPGMFYKSPSTGIFSENTNLNLKENLNGMQLIRILKYKTRTRKYCSCG